MLLSAQWGRELRPHCFWFAYFPPGVTLTVAFFQLFP
jgi:hypothetical protein